MRLVDTDDISFLRDSSTGALLNKDNEGLQMYKKRRQERKKTIELNERVVKLESDLKVVNQQLTEVLDILHQLLAQKVN